jgi:catechol 2,3-dioxygenase-like lactoylglutathione lyase family enzyme
MIVSIHHVSLLVSDTRRALDFYHGILGLHRHHFHRSRRTKCSKRSIASFS